MTISIAECYTRNDSVGNEHTQQGMPNLQEVAQGVDEKKRGPGSAAICASLGVDEQELVEVCEKESVSIVMESASINRDMFGLDPRSNPMLLGLCLAISQSSHLQSFLAGARWMKEQEK